MTTKLVYPVFLECCKYTNDNFWKYIFEDLAYKKTPYGIYIYCDYICCNYKGKEFNYKIDPVKNSKDLFDDIYSLFNKRFELLSEKDKLTRRNLFEESDDKILHLKKNKYNTIFRYIIDMKLKWELTLDQANKLLSYIMLAFLLKLLKSSDMIFDSGKIVSINGIDFKKNKIIYKKNFLKNFNIQASVNNTEKKMSDYWKKYLQKIILKF